MAEPSKPLTLDEAMALLEKYENDAASPEAPVGEEKKRIQRKQEVKDLLKEGVEAMKKRKTRAELLEAIEN